MCFSIAVILYWGRKTQTKSLATGIPGCAFSLVLLHLSALCASFVVSSLFPLRSAKCIPLSSLLTFLFRDFFVHVHGVQASKVACCYSIRHVILRHCVGEASGRGCCNMSSKLLGGTSAQQDPPPNKLPSLFSTTNNVMKHTKNDTKYPRRIQNPL